MLVVVCVSLLLLLLLLRLLVTGQLTRLAHEQARLAGVPHVRHRVSARDVASRLLLAPDDTAQTINQVTYSVYFNTKRLISEMENIA